MSSSIRVSRMCCLKSSPEGGKAQEASDAGPHLTGPDKGKRRLLLAGAQDARLAERRRQVEARSVTEEQKIRTQALGPVDVEYCNTRLLSPETLAVTLHLGTYSCDSTHLAERVAHFGVTMSILRMETLVGQPPCTFSFFAKTSKSLALNQH